MFYDRFKKLCENKGVSCSKATSDIGLSNSTATKWKNTGALPDLETILKIAAYFGVPFNSLIPPILNDEQQEQLLNVFEDAIQRQNLTEGYVIHRSGCKRNFFPQLKNKALPIAPIEEIELVADYLKITDSVQEIILTNPSNPSPDECSKELTMASIHEQVRAKSNTISSDEQRLLNAFRTADPLDQELVRRALHIDQPQTTEQENAG